MKLTFYLVCTAFRLVISNLVLGQYIYLKIYLKIINVTLYHHPQCLLYLQDIAEGRELPSH